MSDPLLSSAYVVLCDWRGRCVWLSSESLLTKPGDFLWDQLAEASQEVARELVARVKVGLRRQHSHSAPPVSAFASVSIAMASLV